jgi:hypothetical protein
MITVVWFGVDTLEASFRGTLNPGFALTLSELKAKAQLEEHPQGHRLAGLDFAVQDHGLKPWPYLLKGDEMHVRFGTSPHFPTASVRLGALGLASYGHQALHEMAAEAVAGVGADQQAGLSRLDLAVDFQGWAPTTEEMGGVVCAASFRPVYPNTHAPETFQYGKGQIVVRVYNKTREIAVKGGAWRSALWQSCRGYRSDEDVWRFEVQLRSEALKELGAHSAHDAFRNLDGLLGYGLTWANLRVPQGQSSDRWQEDERWSALRDATGATRYLQRLKAESRVGDVERLVPMIGGLAVSMAARLGVYNLHRVLGILEPLIAEYAARDGLDFPERARRRTEKLLG